MTPLAVTAAAIVADRKLLLVSKRAAPCVFYLPGGKPDPGETPLRTLERELWEELGVGLDHAEHFGVVEADAALEQVPMRMEVFLTTVTGAAAPRNEIAALQWADTSIDPALLAPAIRDHVLPRLQGAALID
jgi:8-oxo-dGTP diphosphatase